MATNQGTSERASALAQLRFLKGSLTVLLLWPCLTLAFGTIMWNAVQSHLAVEKQRARDQGFQQAQSLAQSYGEQLTRSIGQIDRTALTLAYYWKQSRRSLVLRDQAGLGLFPDAPDFSVGITNRDGIIVSSLLALPGRVDLSDRPYFLAQKSGAVSGLHLARVSKGRISGKPHLLFSRRIDDAQGGFDGIVVVGLSPQFLTSYYFDSQDADIGALTLFERSGELIATGTSRTIWTAENQPLRQKLFAARTGVQALAADVFPDDQSRIVAWNGSQQYPLVAVAALSEESVYAAFNASRDSYLALVSIATIFLATAGLAGSAATARLAWRKHQAAAIADTYRLATEGAREGFFMARALYSQYREVTDFVIENCNEQGAHMFGFQKDQMLSVRFSGIFKGKELARLMATFATTMQDGFLEDEFCLKRRGEVRWIHRRLVRSGDGVAITLRDITSEKSQELALQTLANTDALTSLPNRHWLSVNLPMLLQEAQASGRKAAVLYLDLDNFKDVNNTLGHDAGDLVLREAAARIRAALRPGDHVVRLGGDEFTVILPGIATPDDAALVSSRILVALSSPGPANDGQTIPAIHASVGIGIFPEHGDQMDTLLRHADTAMYAAKTAGKGNHVFYSAGQTDQIVSRLNTEAALRAAVAARQFVLHYQPRVDAVTGHLLGMEALVRWSHPERGMVPPLEFISLAEETGLIVDIGQFVIEQACTQLSLWQKMDLAPVTVSVNVSPIQFERCDMKAVIEAAVTMHAISPRLLELEITESCMMHDSDKVFADIAAIKSLGVRVSVDDFGTGYSSLSQLQKMDLDVLKVDRAFTLQLTDGRHGEAFFKTIISMAHLLDMTVVAEGVETLNQLRVLQTMGCDEIQGYYISKPLPADGMTRLMIGGSLFPEACVMPALA